MNLKWAAAFVCREVVFRQGCAARGPAYLIGCAVYAIRLPEPQVGRCAEGDYRAQPVYSKLFMGIYVE